MPDIPRLPPPSVVFDPSLIPPDAADQLAKETLRLVCWMMTIPRYRDAIEALTAARRRAREARGGADNAG